MAQQAAIRSAETLAALRALAVHETGLAIRCEDRFAKHFLGVKGRILLGLAPQPVLKTLLHAAAPGSYCYAIARTRHFDETLLSALRSGVEQVVLLGAGYDSRPFRFERELTGVRVFEIDHPGTQARKKRILERAAARIPANLTHIEVDFTRVSFQTALAEHGFSLARKTLFLWEGVSYYLPRPVVEDVLDFVGSCAAGSSIVFDYALESFVQGDIGTYGGKQVARWLKKIGEPFLFGLHPAETAAFLAKRNLRVISDLGPAELEVSYLATPRNTTLGKTLGHVRITQAETIGPAAASISRGDVQ